MSNPQLNQEAARVDGEQRAKKAAIGKKKMKEGRQSLVLALVFAIGGFIFFFGSSGGAAEALGAGLLAATLVLLLIGLIYLLNGLFTWRAHR